MSKRLFLAVGVGAAVGGAVAFATRGGYAATFAFRLGAFVLLLAALVAALASSLALRRRGAHLALRVRQATLVAGALTLGSGVVVPLGFWLGGRDVAQARGWCESLTPLLEAHARLRGSYPSDLQSVLSWAPSPPALYPSGVFYMRRDDSFVLTVVEPRCALGAHTYDPEARAWSEFCDP